MMNLTKMKRATKDSLYHVTDSEREEIQEMVSEAMLAGFHGLSLELAAALIIAKNLAQDKDAKHAERDEQTAKMAQTVIDYMEPDIAMTLCEMCGRRANEFNDKERMALSLGANCTEGDSRSKALKITIESIRFYVLKQISEQGVEYDMREDYLQSAWLIVCQNAQFYIPLNGMVTTFYGMYILSAIQDERAKQLGHGQSRYYRYMLNDIKKAREILEKEGNKNPTTFELASCVSIIRGKEVQRVAIEKALAQEKTKCGLDACAEVSDDRAETSPERAYLNAEQSRNFHNMIRNLEQEEQVILHIELELIDEIGVRKDGTLSLKKLHERFKEVIGAPVSADYVKRLRNAAHSDMRRQKETWEKKQAPAAVSRAIVIRKEETIYEEIDIMDEIKNSGDAIFGD